MLPITLHHMRTGWKPLLAAGIAIALGTGFIAATLLGGAAMREAAYQSFTATYRGADFIAAAYPLTRDMAEDVAATAGVERTRIGATVGAEATADGRTEYIDLGATTGEESDLVSPLSVGTLPTTTNEIALSENTADRLNIDVGDTVTLTALVWDFDGESLPTDYTVTGLIQAGVNALSIGPDALATEDTFRSSAALSYDGLSPLLIELAPGTDPAAVRVDLEAALGPDASVLTRAEIAEQVTEMLTGDTQTITSVLLGFAGIALAVAALVIGNTFTVLVAQRTRLLALLRTIGASRRQIRTSVLQEAMLLGVSASVAGLALGYAIIAIAILALSGSVPGIDLWAGLRPGPRIVLVPLIAGVAITLVASWMPARAATRVSPLAAMRPVAVSAGTTAGRVRAAISVLAFAGGVGLIFLGIVVAHRGGDMLLALAAGVLGGFTSVFGVLLGAVFVIRPLIRAVGAIFGRSSAARIAVTGAIRNPRRTSSTTNALFIGVALVVMMSTGAASAKVSLDTELRAQFPVDVQVSTDLNTELTDTQLQALARVPAVEVLTRVRTSVADIDEPGQGTYGFNAWAPIDSRPGGAAADGGLAGGDLTAGAAWHSPHVIDALSDGEFLIDADQADIMGLPTGGDVTLTGPGGSSRDVTLAGTIDTHAVVMTPQTLLEIDPDAMMTTVWLKLNPDANAVDAVESIRTVITELSQTPGSGPVLMVDGGAISRATFTDVIDTMLLVVTALLGVAIIIALVGVANTLSLSVLERRRELATLRALGMTTTQVRSMLAMEGVIIAVAGAIFGTVGGLAYGWAGAYTVLSSMGQVTLAVPWATLGIVFAVAIFAGLLASVLPARSAVKVSPVAALGQE